MILHLVVKELMQYLLYLRFLLIFGVTAILAAVSIYVGTEDYLQRRREYEDAMASHRQMLEEILEDRDIEKLRGSGQVWVRGPEVLSPLVYGITGSLGREVRVFYDPRSYQQPLLQFRSSRIEDNPVYKLFGTLDLMFLVSIFISLGVFVFTHDAICGEKQTGTLSLTCSFSVSRGAVALAKMAGAAIVSLVVLLFACLLAAAFLASHPQISLLTEDWFRIAILFVVFALYLLVFVGFGLWASAATHNRLTAFLTLMALWVLWIFLVPNMAVRIAREAEPVDTTLLIEEQADQLRYEVADLAREDRYALYEQTYAARISRRIPVGDTFRVEDATLTWDDLEDRFKERHDWRLRHSEQVQAIEEKWRKVQTEKIAAWTTERANRAKRQAELAASISAISPLGAATFSAIDVARTGFYQQEEVEHALSGFRDYFFNYTAHKDAEYQGRDGVSLKDRISMSDFAPFSFRSQDTASDALARNLIYIVNLILLIALGFTGAFVSILRYDVR